MKSWLLILGAAITLLNYAVLSADGSKQHNVNQYRNLKLST
jgi:hypothetical protein